MASKKSDELKQKEQSARFKDMARALGADERPEAFDKVLKKVAPKRDTPTTHPTVRKSRSYSAQ
jgi:hypothetical protein